MNWYHIILQVMLITAGASSQGTLGSDDGRGEDKEEGRQLVATAVTAATALASIEKDVADQTLKAKRIIEENRVIYYLTASQEKVKVGGFAVVRWISQKLLVHWIELHNVDADTIRQLDNKRALLGGMTVNGVIEVLDQTKVDKIVRKEGYRKRAGLHLERMPTFNLVGFDIYLTRKACPTPYTEVSGRCFLVETASRNWTSARDHCREKNGKLAGPYDLKPLRNFIIKEHGLGFWFFVDGSDLYKDGVWRQTNGQIIPSSEWEYGAPSDEEDCALVRVSYGLVHKSCTRTFKYVCETEFSY